MSFDSYYSIVIRQQELVHAEVLRADANAAQIGEWIGRLGRTAANAAHILRQAANFGAVMQLRRVR
jgi:hypothetical protein